MLNTEKLDTFLVVSLWLDGTRDEYSCSLASDAYAWAENAALDADCTSGIYVLESVLTPKNALHSQAIEQSASTN